MVSPFHGTPNMPLQLLSITNEWVPFFLASGGIMYSTRRSPPYPPVMPAAKVTKRHRSHMGRLTLERGTIGGKYHSFASGVKFD